MYRNVNDLVENEFYRVNIDKKFYDKLEHYLKDLKYKTAGTDNSEFLGSNLLGVHKFSFSRYDDRDFFRNLLYADESKYERAFKMLEGINPSFKVSSNHTYLTCVVLMHLAYNSKLDKKAQIDVIKDLFMVIAYKSFGSIYNHFFKYPADPAIAKIVFEELNNKYLLKKAGNWQGVFDYRAEDVLPGGIFEERIRNLTVESLVDVVNGIYNRFKDIVKNLYTIYLEVLKKNEKLIATSKITSTGETDEREEEFGDTLGGNSKYITYIKSIITREEDFVDGDLIYVIQTLLPTCKSDKLETFVSGLTKLPYPEDNQRDYIEKILTSSFSYLVTKGILGDYDKKIFVCLKHLKGYWMAGNMKDLQAKQAKEMVNELAYGVLMTPNRTLIPAIAIGFILYVFLKAIKGFKN